MQHVERDFTTLVETLAGYSCRDKAVTAADLQAFGCVALLHEAREGDDDDSWGVVLHRSHRAHFEGRFLPSITLTRPDKYLYYTYAKVNAARVSPSIMLSVAAKEWKAIPTRRTSRRKTAGIATTTSRMIASLHDYLIAQGINVAMLPPSLDVVVPTYGYGTAARNLWWHYPCEPRHYHIRRIVSKGLGVGSVPLPFLATWLLAVTLAVVEIDMLRNVVADRWLWRAVKSESLQGWARARAAMEAGGGCELRVPQCVQGTKSGEAASLECV